LTIPLSVLVAVLGLFLTGHSVNAMTLGGLALAIGRLVDDAIVVLENIVRHRHAGKSINEAIVEGTREVGAPIFVATAATCMVFVPVFFLEGGEPRRRLDVSRAQGRRPADRGLRGVLEGGPGRALVARA